jgi:crotonobetainyl-CoA:carnitine CoA-transferase CaiB-like acyl-CoA transferase
MEQPLEGIRVLEVCHMLAGPFCGMILADLGADVIKIEPPGGDLARSVGPHSLGPHNLYFASLNRNKRSVTLDLTTADGQAALGRLAADAHALVTNLRPAAIRKLGLTYDHLKVFNEKIACLALTGYGLDGAFADRPAYDYVIQALTGIMALTGDPGQPPVKAGYSAVDNSSGIMGAVGLLAKIVQGKGGQIDISLHDVMLSQLNYLAAAYLNAGVKPERQKGGAHPYIIPAQIFATSDGHLAIFVTHDDFWRRFAAAVGRPEWGCDPRYATMAARAENRESLIAAIGALMLTDDTEAWIERLAPEGIVVAGVQSLDAALDGPLVADRAMVAKVATAHGLLRLVANPIRFDGEDSARYGEPPLLGAANAEFGIGSGPDPA